MTPDSDQPIEPGSGAESLRRELRQALDREAATGDILETIRRSPTDAAPVFDAIVNAGLRLFPGAAVSIALPDDDKIVAAAVASASPERAEAWRTRFPFPLNRDYMHGAAMLDARVIDIPDVAAAETGTSPGGVNFLATGFRAVTMTPLMRGAEAIGVLSVVRPDPGHLSDAEYAQLRTFAAQAVIAIENTRMVNELRSRTEELERSQDMLRAREAQLSEQAETLRSLNTDLERKVADQVAEIDRMGRLRRFLPPQIADLIVSSGAESGLASHRREITALFCDLRGFTDFSESADPEDVMAFLRAYHAAIGEIIHRRGGTLERFVGDGAMVIFNDPVPQDDHAVEAVRLALEMRDAVGSLIGRWSRMGHDLGFGVGIALGYATLGTIGFEGRYDYAAIGTVANLAARLCDEAANGEILISGRVLVEVETQVRVDERGEIALKGIKRPVAVFNVQDGIDGK